MHIFSQNSIIRVCKQLRKYINCHFPHTCTYVCLAHLQQSWHVVLQRRDHLQPVATTAVYRGGAKVTKLMAQRRSRTCVYGLSTHVLHICTYTFNSIYTHMHTYECTPTYPTDTSPHLIPPHSTISPTTIVDILTPPPHPTARLTSPHLTPPTSCCPTQEAFFWSWCDDGVFDFSSGTTAGLTRLCAGHLEEAVESVWGWGWW